MSNTQLYIRNLCSTTLNNDRTESNASMTYSVFNYLNVSAVFHNKQTRMKEQEGEMEGGWESRLAVN